MVLPMSSVTSFAIFIPTEVSVEIAFNVDGLDFTEMRLVNWCDR